MGLLDLLLAFFGVNKEEEKEDIYSDFNFEEEELEEDDYYYEDD